MSHSAASDTVLKPYMWIAGHDGIWMLVRWCACQLLVGFGLWLFWVVMVVSEVHK
jgi:hypothetical protein